MRENVFGHVFISFPGGSSNKESACQCRWCGFDPCVRKIPWRKNGNPLQYSYLENSMDRNPPGSSVHGFVELDVSEWLSTGLYIESNESLFLIFWLLKPCLFPCKYEWIGYLVWYLFSSRIAFSKLTFRLRVT